MTNPGSPLNFNGGRGILVETTSTVTLWVGDVPALAPRGLGHANLLNPKPSVISPPVLFTGGVGNGNVARSRSSAAWPAS